MKQKQRGYIQPRIGETHGLFGVKFLKYHNLRDTQWTAEDLITQYEKLSNIYRKIFFYLSSESDNNSIFLFYVGKANNIADLQQEQDEGFTVQRYKRLKKELKDKREVLRVFWKGDLQRTKNVLQDHPKYQRTYQGKQSYEVLEELEHQVFLKQEKLDLYMGERSDLMKHYEEKLVRNIFKELFGTTVINILAGSCGSARNESILRHQRVSGGARHQETPR